MLPFLCGFSEGKFLQQCVQFKTWLHVQLRCKEKYDCPGFSKKKEDDGFCFYFIISFKAGRQAFSFKLATNSSV